jgi:hypothetical protein
MSYKRGRAVGLTFVHEGPVFEHSSHRSRPNLQIFESRLLSSVQECVSGSDWQPFSPQELAFYLDFIEVTVMTSPKAPKGLLMLIWVWFLSHGLKHTY